MKIALIGGSGHYRYALDALSEQNLVGIAPGVPGEDLTKLKKALASRGIAAREYADPRALLPLADVAVVNTRFDKNAEISIEYLNENKFVFSEKPLATAREDLEKLETANAASRAFVAGMFGIRFSPWFRTVQKHLGEIGDLRLVTAQKSYKLGERPGFYRRRETFGGTIPWVAIHAVDWIQTLLKGDPLSVVSALHRADGEGPEICAEMLMRSASGVLAAVTADYLRPAGAPTHGDDRIRVVGTKGVLEAVGGVVTLTDENGETTLPPEPGEDVFRLFLRRCGGEEIGVTPEESFLATRLALTARDLADGGAK